jgi:twitching motility protein PilU
LSAPAVFTYLQEMNAANASDLYITAGVPPTIRIGNKLQPLKVPALTADNIQDILNTILTIRQIREYESLLELNTSLDLGSHGRYRINVLRQRQVPALVIRRIVTRIPTFNELKLPNVMERLALTKRGLILVTGMTGSGKSTTLAAMINHRNLNETGHIITIEDPIEFFHEHKNSVITQREVGVDTESYAMALKNALRQRPDVILIGEIRDREVMEHALMAAETGHLCLATLHTNNAYQSIERVINLFPEEHQYQIRQSVAMNLRAVICQRLVPGVQQNSVLALEILLNEGSIRDLIKEGKINKMRDIMDQNASLGMLTFDNALVELVKQGMITEETAVNNADIQADLQVKLQQLRMKQPGGDALRAIDTSRLAISE